MKPAVWGSQAKELYDQDFFEGTVRNAELLRSGRLDEVDLEHIAEELEDLGRASDGNWKAAWKSCWPIC